MTFYRVDAYVNRGHTAPDYMGLMAPPFASEYADTKEMRDRLIERFEKDGLIVKVAPLEFFRATGGTNE